VVDNKRRHPRLKHRAKIRLTGAAFSEAVVVDMRDFSETGLFLICANELMPPVGTLVEVQTTEFDDAPIQTAVVVRVEPGVGFGLEFAPR